MGMRVHGLFTASALPFSVFSQAMGEWISRGGLRHGDFGKRIIQFSARESVAPRPSSMELPFRRVCEWRPATSLGFDLSRVHLWIFYEVPPPTPPPTRGGNATRGIECACVAVIYVRFAFCFPYPIVPVEALTPRDRGHHV